MTPPETGYIARWHNVGTLSAVRLRHCHRMPPSFGLGSKRVMCRLNKIYILISATVVLGIGFGEVSDLGFKTQGGAALTLIHSPDTQLRQAKFWHKAQACTPTTLAHLVPRLKVRYSSQ